MTQVFNDNVQVDMTIDGEPWLVTEAVVRRSRISTPDYVDINGMLPSPEADDENIPDDKNNLIGASFRLEADNELISERRTGAGEDSLLFSGNLSNISPIGDKRFEGLAYDPSQQGFATLEEEDVSDIERSQAGSVLNQRIQIPFPKVAYDNITSAENGTSYNARIIQASRFVRRVVKDNLGVDEVNIDLSFTGTEISGAKGSYRAGFDTFLELDRTFMTIKDALKLAREQTKSEWWFDKEGVFNFGVPKPRKHELKFIIDADAGKITPPYDSVRIIGSGAASIEGYERSSQFIEDKIVLEREIGLNEDRDPVPVEPDGELTNPFIYRNLEINTDAQAERTMEKLFEELAEQQSKGAVTVVGFPEIIPLDGIKMPNTEQQPMGGAAYGVHEVEHRLNPSDGFITKIHVGSPIGATRTVVDSSTVEEDEEGSTFDPIVDEEIPDGFSSGVNLRDETISDVADDASETFE